VEGNRKVREPVKNGHAKVPVILQMEALECGAASLAMVLAYYGKWIPLEQVRYDCGISRDGSNAKNILQAARGYGMQAKGFRRTPEMLKKEGAFPCIIHWNFNHFVVLDGFKKDRAVLNDPARGCVEVSSEEFDRAFTGVCLQMAPGPDFTPSGKKKSTLAFAKEHLKGEGASMAFVLLTALVAAVIGVIHPAFSRVFLDRLLTNQNPEWVGGFLLLLGALAVLQVVNALIRQMYTLRIEGKMAISANVKFMWHVLHLPVDFFSQRMAGDLAVRKSTNGLIASILLEHILPAVLDILMLVIYLAVMVQYSVLLAAISVCGIVLNVVLTQLVSQKRANITRVKLRDEGKLRGQTVSGIEMIETIKASGAENGYFERWSGYQASLNIHKVDLLQTDGIFTLIPTLLMQLLNSIILGLGLLLVMRGQLTIGMLLVFQTLLAGMWEPVNKLIKATDVIRETGTNMERIDDVMKYETDILDKPSADPGPDGYSKLRGRVEMRNVTFGYSRLAPPLIENFSMVLEPGQKIAFVGASGCGKSTLAKLLVGLYQPWSGEILFDGKPIREIDRNVFTGSIAMVDQDITLFEDTIANNIKMWDESIEDFEMILAARDASLHEIVMQRENGYQYKMLEGGKDFSGGQRQRMEIARVLAQDPTIVIMDEATSALDAKTEYEVVNAIKDRGISCIVIAHRLSTIRDCDEIIVMERGQIVERGRHEELMKLHGKYEEMITSE